MAKTNSGLIAYALAQLGKPYWWGTFGQTASSSLYASKRKQYPSYYTASDFPKQYGQRVHDCIGLIKGYLWSETPTSVPTYVGAQDKSASGMYSVSSIKGGIGTFDFVPGRLLYKGASPSKINHVGVYIGNGWILEAKGHAYGVVKTAFKGSEWSYWSQCPYITADTKTDSGTGQETAGKASKTMNGIDISDVQRKGGLRDIVGFVRQNNIDFVIIKCTRGEGTVNDSFKPWADALTAAGIPWGAYHFLNNNSTEPGATREAENFLKHFAPYVGKAAVFLDYENEDMGFAVGEGYAKEWLDKVRDATGVTPIIYTQQSRVNRLGDIQKAGYPLWVAKYGKNPKITAFNPDQKCEGISPYSDALIYQYSSNLWLSGYNGKLDCNVFYGSADDWGKLCESKKGEKSMVTISGQVPRLRRGDKGTAVKVWQSIIGVEVDGSFGPATEEATKAFQKAHGLVDDGIVGTHTWPAGLGVL